jgi:hypothetical protein
MQVQKTSNARPSKRVSAVVATVVTPASARPVREFVYMRNETDKRMFTIILSERPKRGERFVVYFRIVDGKTRAFSKTRETFATLDSAHARVAKIQKDAEGKGWTVATSGTRTRQGTLDSIPSADVKDTKRKK